MVFTIPAEFKTSKVVFNRERVAFTELYRKYCGPLYSFVLNYTRDEDSAYDLVQESFTRVLGAKTELNTEARFRNYLYTTAVNLCKNRTRLKKERRPDSLEAHEEAGQEFKDAETFQPEMQAESNDLKHQVQALIDALPDMERRVLMLKKIKGMTYTDISEITGSSVRTLKRMVKQTLLDLAEKMEALGITPEGEMA